MNTKIKITKLSYNYIPLYCEEGSFDSNNKPDWKAITNEDAETALVYYKKIDGTTCSAKVIEDSDFKNIENSEYTYYLQDPDLQGEPRVIRSNSATGNIYGYDLYILLLNKDDVEKEKSSYDYDSERELYVLYAKKHYSDPSSISTTSTFLKYHISDSTENKYIKYKITIPNGSEFDSSVQLPNLKSYFNSKIVTNTPTHSKYVKLSVNNGMPVIYNNKGTDIEFYLFLPKELVDLSVFTMGEEVAATGGLYDQEVVLTPLGTLNVNLLTSSSSSELFANIDGIIITQNPLDNENNPLVININAISKYFTDDTESFTISEFIRYKSNYNIFFGLGVNSEEKYISSYAIYDSDDEDIEE